MSPSAGEALIKEMDRWMINVKGVSYPQRAREVMERLESRYAGFSPRRVLRSALIGLKSGSAGQVSKTLLFLDGPHGLLISVTSWFERE